MRRQRLERVAVLRFGVARLLQRFGPEPRRRLDRAHLALAQEAGEPERHLAGLLGLERPVIARDEAQDVVLEAGDDPH